MHLIFSHTGVPIDGVLTGWGEWSSCNATCGYSSRVRNRTCIPPQYNGIDCQGKHTFLWEEGIIIDDCDLFPFFFETLSVADIFRAIHG